MAHEDNLHEQLASLHSISVEIAGLHELGEIHDRALGYCLELTDSEFAFTGLLHDTERRGRCHRRDRGERRGDGRRGDQRLRSQPGLLPLVPSDGVRSSVVGVVIKENRSYIANDVHDDPHSVGQPDGHPPVQRFLGVPLRLGDTVIGMIGVANKAVATARATSGCWRPSPARSRSLSTTLGCMSVSAR